MTFPILLHGDWHKNDRRYLDLGGPRTVPLAIVAWHETQAMRNHGGQTLVRLAERGGLGPDELVAVLEDRPWRAMLPDESVPRLRELLAEVGTHELTVAEIAIADAAGELRVDQDGLGFVPRMWLERLRERTERNNA